MKKVYKIHDATGKDKCQTDDVRNVSIWNCHGPNCWRAPTDDTTKNGLENKITTLLERIIRRKEVIMMDDLSATTCVKITIR